MSVKRSYQARESGIEAMKIIAIILIVISHVAGTALDNPGTGKALDLSHGTDSLQNLLLVVFFHFGRWGNIVFFTCTAWFLLSSDSFDKQKWFFMFFEIWAVSVLILAVSFYFVKDVVSIKDVIKSLFPTYFNNNWYLTCYLLFYPLHSVLNGIINRMNKTGLFRLSIALFCLYCLLPFVKGSFFGSKIIYWITMYFVIAYCKKYLQNYLDRGGLNIVVMAISFLCFIGSVVVMNALCRRYSVFTGQLMHWNADNNPFLFVLSFSMLQIARSIKFRNIAINYVSGLSMLVYILHENIIIRTYFRPQIINSIHTHFGDSQIAVWVVCVALLIFISSVIVAAIYRETLQLIVRKVSNGLFRCLRRHWLAFERKMTRL